MPGRIGHSYPFALFWQLRSKLWPRTCRSALETSSGDDSLLAVCRGLNVECLSLAHFGLLMPPHKEAAFGGKADIISGNQNRPLVTQLGLSDLASNQPFGHFRNIS